MISFNARVTTIIATAITWLAFYEPIGLAGVPHDVLSLAELRKLEKLYQDVTDANDDRVNNYHYLKPLHISDVYQPIDRLNDILESASWKKGVDSNIRHATLSNEEGDSHYVNQPFFSETEVRDGEHLQHSALHGYHEVSGGTAEGEPPQKQVKSDEPLPAYCSPPNPCPVGKTVNDNCVEGFENTIENNRLFSSNQVCACDAEHMWSCPDGQRTAALQVVEGDHDDVSQVIGDLLGLQPNQWLSLSNPYLLKGVKRHNLVAKKTPSSARIKRVSLRHFHSNVILFVIALAVLNDI